METQYQNEVKSPKGQHYQGVVTKRRRLNFVMTAPMQVLSGHCGQRWITTDQQDAWSSCLLHPRVRDSSFETHLMKDPWTTTVVVAACPESYIGNRCRDHATMVAATLDAARLAAIASVSPSNSPGHGHPDLGST